MSTGSANTKNPFIFGLPNGDFVFVLELQLPIAIKDEFLDREVTLKVTTTSTANLQNNYDRLSETQELERLLNPNITEKIRSSFSIQRAVKVIQPFTVGIDTVKLSNINVVTASVKNVQIVAKHPLHIDDLQLYLYDAGALDIRNSASTKRREKVQDYFKVTIPKEGHLPSNLAVTDEHSFVVLIEPIIPTSQPETVKEFPLLSDSFSSQLVFSWTMRCIQGRILSSYKVDLHPPNFQDMMVAMQVQSPVKMNEYFSVTVTLINLSDAKRELRIIIPASNWSSFDSFHPIAKPTVQDIKLKEDAEVREAQEKEKEKEQKEKEQKERELREVKEREQKEKEQREKEQKEKEQKEKEQKEKENQGENKDLKIEEFRDPSYFSPSNSSERSDNKPAAPKTSPRKEIIEQPEPKPMTKATKPVISTPVDLFEAKRSLLPVVCMEHTLYIGKVKPKNSISTNLKFLALREGIFHLEKLKVYDITSQRLYNVVDNCPIYVRDASENK